MSNLTYYWNKVTYFWIDDTLVTVDYQTMDEHIDEKYTDYYCCDLRSSEGSNGRFGMYMSDQKDTFNYLWIPIKPHKFPKAFQMTLVLLGVPI